MLNLLRTARRAERFMFTRRTHRAPAQPAGTVLSTTYRGRKLHYRQGTSDLDVLDEILMRGDESEYAHPLLPPRDDVRMVLDIGANIGAASMFFASRYPQATVHAFEPVPNNFDVLSRNAASWAPRQIVCHHRALSDHDAELTLIGSPASDSVNAGGWSFYQRGAQGHEPRITVPVRRAGDYLQELGISRIDLIKIDTEGAEKEILHGLDDAQLETVRFIVGEVHGERDFELFDWLEQRGFDLELHKRFGRKCFIFRARRASR